MRKLREAAVMAAVVGGVSMIGAGTAAAHGDEKPPTKVYIHCTQDTGDNTNTNQPATGLVAVNVSDLLNGGDASADANQQVCGLENENIQNEAGDSEAGDGGSLGSIIT